MIQYSKNHHAATFAFYKNKHSSLLIQNLWTEFCEHFLANEIVGE
jgi:hypothetical protein